MLKYKVYRTNEELPWVTFIHGAGGSSNIWHKQIDHFQSYFNLLLVDLRGHGASAQSHSNVKKYTFDDVTNDILIVLDKEKIEKTHFVGISLGSMVIRNFIHLYPERCKKAVLGGMISRLNLFAKVLLFLANRTKNILPIMTLYKILAKIILPRKSHENSKRKFINEAMKLSREEFMKWFRLTNNLKEVFLPFRNHATVPVLYIQGSQDYLFLNDMIAFAKNRKNEMLEIIENCGHLVNIQSAKKFNNTASSFLLQPSGDRY